MDQDTKTQTPPGMTRQRHPGRTNNQPLNPWQERPVSGQDRTLSSASPQALPFLTSAAIGRFWASVNKDGTRPRQAPRLGPCWHWTAHVDHEGYGRFQVGGSSRGAHRIAYQIAEGPIGPGLHLDHLCHNGDPECPSGAACLHRRCVNATHLEAVPPRTNILRGNAKAAQNARATHCHAGHEFDGQNTSVAADGSRECRACARDRMNAIYRSRPGFGLPDPVIRALFDALDARPSVQQMTEALIESGVWATLGNPTPMQMRAITTWSLRRIEKAEPELALKYPAARRRNASRSSR